MPIKRAFLNLKIKHKLIISMIFTSMCASLFIGALSYVFVSRFFFDLTSAQVDNAAEITKDTLARDIAGLYKNVVKLVANSAFVDLANDIEKRNGDDFAINYIAIQEPLEALAASYKLIAQVSILGSHGEFFSSYSVGLRYKNDNQFIWKDADGSGILWMSTRQNPTVEASQQVIPIIIPIYLSSYGQLPFITTSREPPLMTLVIFLSTEKFNEYVEQMNTIAESCAYLADRGGNPLTLGEDSWYRSIAALGATRSAVAALPDHSKTRKSIEGGDYAFSVMDLGMSGLRLVNVMSMRMLTESGRIINLISLLVVLLSLPLSVLIATPLSRTITNPIGRLMRQVSRIESGDYDASPISVYADEVGTLSKSISAMSGVISRQIRKIREDEQERTRAEIELLAQQINPHFLYNTLDCVHWEILRGNAETATKMVESLGSFLRLSLSYGSDTVSIPDEFLRIEQYITIMNHRLGKKIRFVSQLDTELQEHRILKLVLLPLVENCIKHGFKEGQTGSFPDDALVCLSASRKEDRVLLCVEDNGVGIDIEKAERALADGVTEGKVGLRNIYLRLLAYYGSGISIRFESLPFYKNVAILSIPLSRAE